jgi:hypothetical protein
VVAEVCKGKDVKIASVGFDIFVSDVFGVKEARPV